MRPKNKPEAVETFLGGAENVPEQGLVTTVMTDIPPELAYYAVDLGMFFHGMVQKLAKNSHKGDVIGGNPIVIAAEAITEVAELVEQLGMDQRDPNMVGECYDVSNYGFLLFRLLLDNGARLEESKEKSNDDS